MHKKCVTKVFSEHWKTETEVYHGVKGSNTFLEDNQTLINPQEVNIKPKSKELISN